MKTFAIIVAGGKGTRMGNNTPKQFLLLNQKPVLMHTISRFFAFDKTTEITIVLPIEQIEYWSQLCIKYNFEIPHKIVTGGAQRYHSVKNALATLPNEGIVAIHDGVRPLVNSETIINAFISAEKNSSGIPSLPLYDSIRKLNQHYNIAVNRHQYCLIQTPQCFNLALIKKAYQDTDYNDTFTDDAAVFENAGNDIFLTHGNIENIKITNPTDLLIATALIN